MLTAAARWTTPRTPTTTDKPPKGRRGKPLEPPKKAVHARGGAHIRARNASTRKRTHKHASTQRTSASTHSRRTAQRATRTATRADKAQHVTKPPQRGQIRALWSKSINDATARLSCKIRALQAAKRQAGQHARTSTRKGRGEMSKGGEMYDGGNG